MPPFPNRYPDYFFSDNSDTILSFDIVPNKKYLFWYSGPYHRTSKIEVDFDTPIDPSVFKV